MPIFVKCTHLAGAHRINLQKADFIAYYCKIIIGCHQSSKRGRLKVDLVLHVGF
jgi:hypothetical protein